MKILLTGLLIVGFAVAAQAQSLAETLTARLSDQVLTLQEIGPDQRPGGQSMTMRLFASGAA